MNPSMKPNAGLWLDHREAIVVFLNPDGTETRRIQSSVEKQLRRSGDRADGRFEDQAVPADDSRERSHMGELARYYDEIVAAVSSAGAIFICGPGEAKGELRKRFGALKNDTRSIVVESSDRLTEHQVVAQVRNHFGSWLARNGG